MRDKTKVAAALSTLVTLASVSRPREGLVTWGGASRRLRT